MDKVKQLFMNLWQNKKAFWSVIAVCLVIVVGIVAAVALLPGSEPENPDGTQPSGKNTYSLNAKTEGGKILSDIEVFIYADAALEDLFAVGRTDAEGKYAFEAAAGNYYAVLKNVPKGYVLESSYAVTSQTSIVLKTELLLPSSMKTEI